MNKKILARGPEQTDLTMKHNPYTFAGKKEIHFCYVHFESHATSGYTWVVQEFVGQKYLIGKPIDEKPETVNIIKRAKIVYSFKVKTRKEVQLLQQYEHKKYLTFSQIICGLRIILNPHCVQAIIKPGHYTLKKGQLEDILTTAKNSIHPFG